MQVTKRCWEEIHEYSWVAYEQQHAVLTSTPATLSSITISLLEMQDASSLW